LPALGTRTASEPVQTQVACERSYCRTMPRNWRRPIIRRTNISGVLLHITSLGVLIRILEGHSKRVYTPSHKCDMHMSHVRSKGAGKNHAMTAWACAGAISPTRSTAPSRVGSTNRKRPWATFLSRCMAFHTASRSSAGISVGKPSDSRICCCRRVVSASTIPSDSAKREAQIIPIEIASP
jgi:hypothetical protein